MANPMVQSEILFQRYCHQSEHRCDHIEVSKEPHVHSPDFSVSVNGREIIVEVKELSASKEEIELWRQTNLGKSVVHCHEPGKRARKRIEDAVGQLRFYAQKGIPTVVVLYDTIFFEGLVNGQRPHPSIYLLGHLGPYDMDVALYGLQMVNVCKDEAGNTESVKDGRSRRRMVHDRECISAVSVLFEHPDDKSLFMRTYHNFFAQTQLPRSVFAEKDDRHYIKLQNPDVCPGNWANHLNPE